jgi:hypothetical protein
VHEMQLEAALHVTSFTAGQCMHMYGSAPDISANSKAPKEARTRRPPVRTPSERELEARLQKLREFSSMNGNRKDLAACLTSQKRRPGGLLQMGRDYPAGCGLLQASWANSPGLTAMVQLAEQRYEQPECEKECSMMP